MRDLVIAAEDAVLSDAETDLRSRGVAVHAVRTDLSTYEGVEQLVTSVGRDGVLSRADMEGTKVGAGSKDDPAQVARQGFDAMMAGEEKVVAGSLTTKAQGLANKVLPDSVKATMHRAQAEPGSGE